MSINSFLWVPREWRSMGKRWWTWPGGSGGSLGVYFGLKCSWSVVSTRNLMASYRHFPVALLVCAAILGVASDVEGQVLFSKLPKSLVVTATLPGGGPLTGSGLQTGQDSIEVTWTVNTTAVPVTFSKVQTKLCFAKQSQVDRSWRKTDDDLSKDKTCPYEIAVMAYAPAGASVNVLLPNFVPRGYYFVRAYAIGANGLLVAYGQSSPDNVADTFFIHPISGRNKAMSIAATVLSVLSVVSLFTYILFEAWYMKVKKTV